MCVVEKWTFNLESTKYLGGCGNKTSLTGFTNNVYCLLHVKTKTQATQYIWFKSEVIQAGTINHFFPDNTDHSIQCWIQSK